MCGYKIECKHLEWYPFLVTCMSHINYATDRYACGMLEASMVRIHFWYLKVAILEVCRYLRESCGVDYMSMETPLTNRRTIREFAIVFQLISSNHYFILLNFLLSLTNQTVGQLLLSPPMSAASC